MVWVYAALAIVVLGVAAIAGSGRLGEMAPPEEENFGGRIPDGELSPDELGLVRFGRAHTGYARGEVDDFIDRVQTGQWQGEMPEFAVVRGGYLMTQVDGVLDRIGLMRNNGVRSPDEAPGHEEVRKHNGSDEATYG